MYLCFGFAHMLLLEEELTVQVADINCVEVNLQKVTVVYCHVYIHI